MPEQNRDRPDPFFIVGSVRAGTTLLRLMVGRHPELCRCEEFEFVTEAIAGKRDWPDMDEYRHYLQEDRGFRLSGYHLDASLGFVEQARDFLEQRRKADGGRLVGAAVHAHFDELPRVWPGARYLFLNRDPRDVARSCVQMGFVGSAWYGARYWVHVMESWRRLRSMVPPERLLELTFEDMVRAPEEQLRRVCEFLGVQFEERMLAVDEDSTYSPPDPSNARSWRDSATSWEVRQIEAQVTPQRMLEAGYQPVDEAGGPLGFWERLRVEWQDLVGRVRFRVRRYGMRLWLAGIVSRRLPFAGWRRSVKFRLDEIENQHMK